MKKLGLVLILWCCCVEPLWAVMPPPDSLRDSIETVRKERKLMRWVEDAIVVNDNKEVKKLNQQRENEYIQQFEGRTIRDIHIFRNNIFENNKVWVDRVANKIHRVTREGQIRNDLLFRSGDPFDPDLMLNNQQLIRSRPYISDIKIIAEPVPDDSTQVDVFVLTRDTWTISADASISSKGESFIELYDKNILGYGNTLRVRTYFDWKEGAYGGNQVEYSIPNILGSFLGGRAIVGKGFDEVIYGGEINKEFIKPQDYAVGGSAYYDQRDIKIRPLDSIITAADTHYDLWGGQSFLLSRLGKSSFFYTGRYYNRSFSKRPNVTADLNPYFHDERLALFSVGVYRERFQAASLIYGYGVTEYLPYGFRVNLTGGYSWGEFGNRYYLGGEATAGHSTGIGYLSWRFGIGSYLNQANRRLYRSTLTWGVDYFSDLITSGRYQIRQFVNLALIKGWNRQEGYREMIGFTSKEGLRGLRDKVYGINRLVLNSETVIFSPWKLYQFRFALFGFLDAGLLGTDGNLFKNPFYSTLGVGVRIKNEKLIFQTINIRLGVALNRNGFADAEYFRISSEDRRNPVRFIPHRPDVIAYE